jgi:hypothetical protein
MTQAPPPPPQDPVWYYLAGQQRLGPIPTQTMLHLIEGGSVSGGTLVWRQGFGEWAPIGSVPEFAFAFTGPGPATSINAMMHSKKEAALGLTTGGLVLFIVLLLVCWPLCWLPWFVKDMRSDQNAP